MHRPDFYGDLHRSRPRFSWVVVLGGSVLIAAGCAWIMEVTGVR